ncbi:MAG: DNA repair protein RecN, partial [Flavobacteriales bacterium]
MLQQLSIQNYALIEQISTQLQPGLTALTGETGSGKSIILGALGLILGERVDSSVLRNQESKCIIEGLFLIDDHLKNFFDENDLDFDTNTSIRREITPKGKSRAFINDTPATLAQLKTLGSKLVDIHSQQEQGRFNELGFRIAILDAAAQTEELSQAYQLNYKKLKTLELELSDLEEAERNARSDQDYIEFQLNELNEAQLDNLDLTELEAKNSLLENAESIQTATSGLGSILENSENSVIAGIGQAIQLLQPLINEHKGIEELAQRLQSTKIELQDIAQESESIGESAELNPAQMAMIQSQLDVIYRLQKKHHLIEVNELINLKEELSQRLDGIGHLDDQIQELRKDIAKAKEELEKQATQLS